jgi:hypothetical protein
MKNERGSMKVLMLGCTFFLMLFGCIEEEAITASDDASRAASSQNTFSQNSLTDGPAPPQNVRLDPTYNQTPFSIQLTWDAPPWTDVLIYRGTSSTIEAVASYDANLDPHYRYTLNNLQQNTSYSFRFQSQINGSERGPISDLFTFTTLPTNDHASPTAPSNLAVTCDPYTIFLTWNGSSDNYDPASEITYEFYNASTGNLVLKSKGSTHLAAPNGGVSFVPGGNYLVRARDRSGNLSDPSNSVIVTGCS